MSARRALPGSFSTAGVDPADVSLFPGNRERLRPSCRVSWQGTGDTDTEVAAAEEARGRKGKQASESNPPGSKPPSATD